MPNQSAGIGFCPGDHGQDAHGGAVIPSVAIANTRHKLNRIRSINIQHGHPFRQLIRAAGQPLLLHVLLGLFTEVSRRDGGSNIFRGIDGGHRDMPRPGLNGARLHDIEISVQGVLVIDGHGRHLPKVAEICPDSRVIQPTVVQKFRYLVSAALDQDTSDIRTDHGHRIVCGSVDASDAVDCLCGIHIVNVSLNSEGGQHGGNVAHIQRVNETRGDGSNGIELTIMFRITNR